VAKLNDVLAQSTSAKEKQKAQSLKKELQGQQDKIEKYERQLETCQQRSGYNSTDEDATALRMKNEELLPAYNVLAGSEEQFIVGLSVHQNGNDAACFAEHLQALERQAPALPGAIVADSIFGTEQNYDLLDQNRIGNYMKFPSFHHEGSKSYEENAFAKENFAYDVLTDTYQCPAGKLLIYQQSVEVEAKSGYVSQVKQYESEGCGGCPFYEQCCKSRKQNNRTITVSEKLEAYKEQARANLKSERGIELRKLRGVEIESCFGDIKHNMGFRRLHLRGKKKVNTEFILLAMAHNVRKVHIKRLEELAKAA
jgi:hypothetical protein